MRAFTRSASGRLKDREKLMAAPRLTRNPSTGWGRVSAHAASSNAAALLKAVGHGDTRPLGPNNTPEERQRNRRVEVVLGE